MTRSKAASLVVAGFLALALHGASAQAQTFAGGQKPGVYAWCSAENGDRQQFYITQARKVTSGSPLALGSLSGHFAQTVNSRFGMHLIMTASHCASFRKREKAEAARAVAIMDAKKKDLVITDPGIF